MGPAPGDFRGGPGVGGSESLKAGDVSADGDRRKGAAQLRRSATPSTRASRGAARRGAADAGGGGSDGSGTKQADSDDEAEVVAAGAVRSIRSGLRPRARSGLLIVSGCVDRAAPSVVRLLVSVFTTMLAAMATSCNDSRKLLSDKEDKEEWSVLYDVDIVASCVGSTAADGRGRCVLKDCPNGVGKLRRSSKLDRKRDLRLSSS